MRTLDVAIIGAGISGLSTAHWLKKQNASVAVLEASSNAGGVTGSLHEDGFVIEKGPNSLLDNEPALMELVKEFNLEVLRPNARSQKRFLYYEHQIHDVPMSPKALMQTDLLTGKGKLSLLKDLLVRKRQSPDESIHSFPFGLWQNAMANVKDVTLFYSQTAIHLKL